MNIKRNTGGNKEVQAGNKMMNIGNGQTNQN